MKRLPPLFLASQSPRRRDLLNQAGMRFRVFIPQQQELPAPKRLRKQTPQSIVCRIAKNKALAAFLELNNRGVRSGLLIAADTLVFCEGKVLGKPKSKADAEKMLRNLSGNWHFVYSAVTCLYFSGNQKKEKTIYVKTKVKFHQLKEDWIRWYVSTGEPMDKAGAYGAQGPGASFIAELRGSYTNVVGLPLGPSIALLEETSGFDRRFFRRSIGKS